jgi:hypothetical protein
MDNWHNPAVTRIQSNSCPESRQQILAHDTLTILKDLTSTLSPYPLYSYKNRGRGEGLAKCSTLHAQLKPYEDSRQTHRH